MSSPDMNIIIYNATNIVKDLCERYVPNNGVFEDYFNVDVFDFNEDTKFREFADKVAMNFNSHVSDFNELYFVIPHNQFHFLFSYEPRFNLSYNFEIVLYDNEVNLERTISNYFEP